MTTFLADPPAVYGHCGWCGHRFTSTADQDHHLAQTGHGRIEFIVDNEAERTPAHPGGSGAGRPASRPHPGRVDGDGTRAVHAASQPAPSGAGPDLRRHIQTALAMHPAGSRRRALPRLTAAERAEGRTRIRELRQQLARARHRRAA